ncbi:MAG: helix-turn-helix domain-containing protein [Limnobacter sp.]|jgi:transcriptional regulator with XRE-family HTH domain
MNLNHIGLLVQQRRQEIGLSQGRLARLSGLSRATINQLESGTIQELGAVKLIGLLDLLGITLETGHTRRKRNALKLVSQTASVSYKNTLDSSALAQALVAGELPTNMLPHVATLLDEAPLPLIVSAIEEIADDYKLAPKSLWKNMTKWAEQLKSNRGVWF